jgi:hypothetical protein
MRIKVGDLQPNLSILCTSSNVPVDLTTATTIQFVCRRDGATSALWTRTGTGTAQGVATYTWQTGDTAASGRLLFEVKVTWPSSKPQRYPPIGSLVVDVVENLD